jgi:hypothetical protein
MYTLHTNTNDEYRDSVFSYSNVSTSCFWFLFLLFLLISGMPGVVCLLGGVVVQLRFSPFEALRENSRGLPKQAMVTDTPLPSWRHRVGGSASGCFLVSPLSSVWWMSGWQPREGCVCALRWRPRESSRVATLCGWVVACHCLGGNVASLVWQFCRLGRHVLERTVRFYVEAATPDEMLLWWWSAAGCMV